MKPRGVVDPNHWREWLRCAATDNPERMGFDALALGAITGQDAYALSAVSGAWELYAAGDRNGQQAALASVRALLVGMQPQCHKFARALIARALDWHDRDRLWFSVAPPPDDPEETARVAAVFDELLKDLPSTQQVELARKFLDGYGSITGALMALATSCEISNADHDPAWEKVSNALVAALRVVAEAEAAAL